MQELEVMVNQCGFGPREAIWSATMEAARMMNLSNDLGSLEIGKMADVIAVPNDPLEDISALRRVFFVMKNGQVYWNDHGGSAFAA